MIIPSQSGSNPDNMFLYTVKKGDTLYSIAKKYGVLPDTIIQDNALKNANLSIGQNLKIRVTPSSFNVEECFGEDSNIELPNNNVERYVVQKGDTLYSISKRFNTPINTIVQFNKLNGNVLNVGQILQIPVSNYTYIVQRGDTLYAIARRFQKSVDEIKKKNNLNTNNLIVGQQLLV